MMLAGALILHWNESLWHVGNTQPSEPWNCPCASQGDSVVLGAYFDKEN